MTRGGAGWLALGLVLLVPLIGFWQWRQGMRSKKLGGSPGRQGAPAFAGGAASAQGAARPSPGISTSAPAGAPLTEAAPAPLGGFPPGLPAPGTSVSAPAGASPPGAAPAAVSGAAPSEGSAGAPGASGESGFNPKTDRDPTLSPNDLKLLEAERLREKNPPPAPAKPQVPSEPPIEDRIQLLGIVATASSVNAIVNGERVRVRDEVADTGVRVRRITATCVEFEYKRRSFSKCLEH